MFDVGLCDSDIFCFFSCLIGRWSFGTSILDICCDTTFASTSFRFCSLCACRRPVVCLSPSSLHRHRESTLTFIFHPPSLSSSQPGNPKTSPQQAPEVGSAFPRKTLLCPTVLPRSRAGITVLLAPPGEALAANLPGGQADPGAPDVRTGAALMAAVTTLETTSTFRA